VWIEEAQAPTPTSFALTPIEEQLPSSRTPATVEPPTPSARARSRRVAVKHHWLAIVVTFVAVATLVADGDEIARIVNRLRNPAKSLFHFGGGIAAASTDETTGPCSKDMALVDGGGVRVCVDRFEDAVVEIDAQGKEHEHSPYLSVEGLRVKAVSSPNVVPQAYISRDEGEAACKEAGKRLCKVDEWRSACMGPSQTLYPYGNDEDGAACNTHGVEPLGALFPNYGAEIYDFRVMNDPSLDALEGTVSKTGEYPKCSNGWGVFDMVGNLHEWTTEVTGTKGEFHGGYYLDTHQNGDGCKYATYVHERTYHDYSTGFRCCADPK
jgi:hypothetical protein